MAESILVVDDEPAVLSFIARALDANGFSVIRARDGLEALGLLDTVPRIDLLLTDVLMPNLGGVDLADRIRRLRPQTGILFMSGYCDHEACRRAFPAVRLLRKPFSLANLLAHVRMALPRKSAAFPLACGKRC